MAIRYTFRAYERLKREQHINTLFQSGKAFSVFPVRFVYKLQPIANAASPVQIGFSVPKKKFRSSVKRHRVRRLLFEAWRLNKHLLYSSVPEKQQLHLFVIFTDVTLPEQAHMVQIMQGGIERLIQLLEVPVV